MSNFRVVLINAMKTYYLKVKLSRRIEGLYRKGKLSYKLVNRVPVAFDFDLYLKQMVRRIRHLCCVPHAVFTPDTMYASVAVREANVLSLPLIGVVDSYSSIFSVAYPIPGNTQSFSSVMFFYKLVRLVILKGFITEHLRFYRKLTNKFTMNNGRFSKAKKKKLNFLLKKRGSSETKLIKKVSKFLNKT